VSGTEVVSGLRARPGVLALGSSPESPNAITIRVSMPDLWDTLAVRCDADTPVLAVKRAALQEFGQHLYPAEDYVLKLRGFEVLDETAPVSVAGARDGSTFLLAYRRRRPVR
jgi:hypothetical protein